MFTWILVKTDISTSFCVYFSVHAMRRSTQALWDTLSVCVCFSVCAQKTGPNWVLSCIVRLIHMSSLLLLLHFWTFYAPCSKCILAYVLPVHMFTSNLLCSRFVLSESLPKSSLPNIFISFLFVAENVNIFTSKFLSFKRSFRSLSSRCRQWKKMSLMKIMTKMIRQWN